MNGLGLYMVSQMLIDNENHTHFTAHTRFIESIRTYLLDNLIIPGVYSGVTSSGSDPFNGPYTWKLNDMIINISLFLNPSSFNSWTTAIQAQIRLGQLKSVAEDGPIIIPSKFLTEFVFTLSQGEIASAVDYSQNGLDNMNNIYNVISSKLEFYLEQTILSNSAATSSAGAGTVTFTNLILN